MTKDREVPSESGADSSSEHFSDRVVFDDDFVRGGVHEPPARTREAIARYGNDRSSWRHSAPAPVATPRKARWLGRGAQRRGKLPLILSVVAAVVVVGPILFLKGYTTRGVPNLAGIPHAPVNGTITAATGMASARSTFSGAVVEGITPVDLPGSCYLSATTTGKEQLSMLDCGRPHTYELVSREKAQGPDATYPAGSYWANTVAPVCYRDQLAYMKKTRDVWPGAVTSNHFQPLPGGWANGERSVFCVAKSDPPTRGSVKG